MIFTRALPIQLLVIKILFREFSTFLIKVLHILVSFHSLHNLAHFVLRLADEEGLISAQNIKEDGHGLIKLLNGSLI